MQPTPTVQKRTLRLAKPESVFNETRTSRIKLSFCIRFAGDANGPYCHVIAQCCVLAVDSCHCGPVCDTVLLCMPSAIPPPFPNAGQTVYLKAKNTGQTAPFTVTFGDGQPTSNVNSLLPTCNGFSKPTTFIRMEKTDGSFLLYNGTGSFFYHVNVYYNDYEAEHPILTTSYSGRYHCRIMTGNSTDTYQLNIVGKYGILSFFLLNDAKLWHST